MNTNHEVGDLVEYRGGGWAGEIIALCVHGNDALFGVKRDDGECGTGPDDSWVTDAFESRRPSLEPGMWVRGANWGSIWRVGPTQHNGEWEADAEWEDGCINLKSVGIGGILPTDSYVPIASPENRQNDSEQVQSLKKELLELRNANSRLTDELASVRKQRDEAVRQLRVAQRKLREPKSPRRKLCGDVQQIVM